MWGGDTLTCHHMLVEVGGQLSGVDPLLLSRMGLESSALGTRTVSRRAISPTQPQNRDPKFAGRIKGTNEVREEH